jgi:hypothetical protein
MKYSFLLISILFTINLSAQSVGDKVFYKAADGKEYTGLIKEIKGDQYLVKYDGVDFEAWLTRDQFTITNSTQPQTTKNTNGNWKVGDKVEAYDIYTSQWENATIIVVYTDRATPQWRALLDDPAGHAIADLLVTAQQIRARGSKPAQQFAVNTLVDVNYADGKPKGRGIVKEVLQNGRYLINYVGCGAHFDEKVDWSQVKPAATVSANNPDITATFGKWAMFVYSYPNTYTDGNNIYRVYGTGAKAPPLLINANGTYVWYDEFNKPPVKGNWATSAKIEGLDMGTETKNGILIKDSRGIWWKIYKDRQDHIEARKLCSGETSGGTKIK